MPEPLLLPARMSVEIEAHCVAALPDEGCGLFAISERMVARVYPTRNQDASPRSYTVPPEEHYWALVDAESHGWQLGGVFHSHPEGEPRPSRRDIDRAIDPELVHIIVATAGRPMLRAWSIRGRRAVEVPIESL